MPVLVTYFVLFMCILWLVRVPSHPVDWDVDVYSGWGRAVSIRYGGSSGKGPSPNYAIVQCYEGSGRWRDVTPEIRIPDNQFPACETPAGIEALGDALRGHCPGRSPYEGAAGVPFMTRADGSPLIIPQSQILDAVQFDQVGEISIVDRNGYPVLKSETNDLWVPVHPIARRPGRITFVPIDTLLGRRPLASSHSHVYDRLFVDGPKQKWLVARLFTVEEGGAPVSIEVSLVCHVPRTDPVVVGEEEDRCAVCLTPVVPSLAEGQVCRPCFNEPCLSKSLSRRELTRNCPVCESPLPLGRPALTT